MHPIRHEQRKKEVCNPTIKKSKNYNGRSPKFCMCEVSHWVEFKKNNINIENIKKKKNVYRECANNNFHMNIDAP